MRTNRKLGYYILLNVAVSALTTIIVLFIWGRSNPLPPQQELAITLPAGGEQAGPPPTQASSAGNDQPANPELAPGDLEITSIVGAGDPESERVSIRYNGSGELSLAGWQLRDEDGNAFIFPALTMFSGGAVTVHTRSGADTVVELYWGQGTPVWTPGEEATLADANGETQATYIVP